MRDELDTLIDATAREMTALRAPQSIADDVRTRIAAGDRRGLPLWIPAMATAALVLLVGVTIARWPRQTPPVAAPSPTSSVAQDRVLRPPAPAMALPAVPRPEVAVAARATTRQRPRIATAPIAPLDVMPLVIEPLAEPQLIAIDTSNQVTPIEIDPLRIDPIDTQ
jgi:hypothetical protein